MISRATDTTMSNPVAENELANPRLYCGSEYCPDNAKNKNVGTSEMIIRKRAPNNVIRLLIFLKKSLVGFPALMPGINPPYC